RFRTAPAGARPPGQRQLLKVSRYPLAWQVMGFMGLQSLIYYATLSWLPTLFRDRGADPVHAGTLLAVMNLGNAVTLLLIPLLAHRTRDPRVRGRAPGVRGGWWRSRWHAQRWAWLASGSLRWVVPSPGYCCSASAKGRRSPWPCTSPWSAPPTRWRPRPCRRSRRERAISWPRQARWRSDSCTPRPAAGPSRSWSCSPSWPPSSSWAGPPGGRPPCRRPPAKRLRLRAAGLQRLRAPPPRRPGTPGRRV